MADNDDDDKKVKDLLDAKTRAELERWFGMPSFEQLADRGIVPAPPPAEEDPEIAARAKRYEEAIAAADPRFLEAHGARTAPADHLIRFKAVVDVRVDPGIALFDFEMAERQQSIAEPRERELPEELNDDMKECAPQALLRDLHRPEIEFNKVFEVVDIAAEQRLDIVAMVAEAMRTSWALPPFTATPLQEARELLAAMREDRLVKPWTEIEIPKRTGGE